MESHFGTEDSVPSSNSKSRSQILSQFLDVTHISAQRGQQILDSCEWNIEAAVALHLAESDFGVEPAEARDESTVLTDLDSAGAHNATVRQRTSRGNGTDAVASSVSSPVMTSSRSSPSSPSTVWSSMQEWFRKISAALGLSVVIQFVVRIFSVIAALGRVFVLSAVGVTSLGTTEPSSFATFFSAQYGPSGPQFFSGTFAQATQEARRRRCLVVVYIHCELARFTDDFCRRVLCDEAVKEVLNDSSTFILWGTLESREAHRVFQPTRFPHISIVMPDNLANRVGLLEGEMSVDELISVLAGSAASLHDFRDMLASQDAQQMSDRDLRAQQDLEYEESLRLDAIREEQRQQEEEAKRLENENLAKEEELHRIEMESLRELRRRYAESFRAEDLNQRAKSATPPDVTRICLRLPSGVRVERHFSSSDSVERLYQWAAASEVLYPDKVPPEEVPRKFGLTSPLSPPLTENSQKCLRDVGLVPNALILLNRKDDEDERDG